MKRANKKANVLLAEMALVVGADTRLNAAPVRLVSDPTVDYIYDLMHGEQTAQALHSK